MLSDYLETSTLDEMATPQSNSMFFLFSFSFSFFFFFLEMLSVVQCMFSFYF